MNTTRTFKAKRNQLIVEFLGVLGGGVALVFWKGAAVTPFLLVFLLVFLGYRLLLNGIAIKTVILRSDGVEIVPLFPWFKPRRWKSDQLASYKSGALSGRVKSRPFVGFLMPKVGKMEMLWAIGTERFSELDELLSNLLPPPEEPTIREKLTSRTPNHPAPGKAGTTSPLTIERHWPGLPDQGRSHQHQVQDVL